MQGRRRKCRDGVAVRTPRREKRKTRKQKTKVNDMDTHIMQDTNNEKPAFTEWLRSLKVKAQVAEREEEEERRWRELQSG